MATIVALHASTLDEFRSFEAEAVMRLNQQPTIARLFLSAPVQALAAVGVTLAPQAIEEWTAQVGFLPTITDDAFALRRNATAIDVTVTIHGIFRPVKARGTITAAPTQATEARP